MTPTKEQVIEFADFHGFDKKAAETYFLNFDGQGWLRANGQKIINWQSHFWWWLLNAWPDQQNKASKIMIDKSFGKCCFFHGSTACCETGAGSIKFVWRENKPFGKVNCYDQWVKKGKL